MDYGKILSEEEVKEFFYEFDWEALRLPTGQYYVYDNKKSLTFSLPNKVTLFMIVRNLNEYYFDEGRAAKSSDLKELLAL